MGRQRCCKTFAIMSREEPISGGRNNNDETMVSIGTKISQNNNNNNYDDSNKHWNQDQVR